MIKLWCLEVGKVEEKFFSYFPRDVLMYESPKLVEACWWRHVRVGTIGIGTTSIGMLPPTTKDPDINDIFILN